MWNIRIWEINDVYFDLLRLFAGANKDNSTEHEGSVHLEEHEAHSNMMSAPKAIEIPDELDWRDFGRR